MYQISCTLYLFLCFVIIWIKKLKQDFFPESLSPKRGCTLYTANTICFVSIFSSPNRSFPIFYFSLDSTDGCFKNQNPTDISTTIPQHLQCSYPIVDCILGMLLECIPTPVLACCGRGCCPKSLVLTYSLACFLFWAWVRFLLELKLPG